MLSVCLSVLTHPQFLPLERGERLICVDAPQKRCGASLCGIGRLSQGVSGCAQISAFSAEQTGQLPSLLFAFWARMKVKEVFCIL